MQDTFICDNYTFNTLHAIMREGLISILIEQLRQKFEEIYIIPSFQLSSQCWVVPTLQGSL